MDLTRRAPAVENHQHSRSPGPIDGIAQLRAWLRSPEDDELRRAFADWVREVAQRFMPAGETLPPEMTLEDKR